MVQETGSRQRCRSWTVLHAQCISVLSSGFPILQGNAEALERWGGKTKHCLISYFLSNISTRNYRNRIVYVQTIASQRWYVFSDMVYVVQQLCAVKCWRFVDYSNKKMNKLLFKNVCIITILLRKWCHNDKRLAELAPHHGGKTAGIDIVWRNYVTVTLCIRQRFFRHDVGQAPTAVAVEIKQKPD